MLQDLVTLNESVEAAVVVYLLGNILNDFNSTNMADQEQLIEVYRYIIINICTDVIMYNYNRVYSVLATP